ncbi:hypothetical protein EJ571_14255 [Mycobacteroides franklinii]|uniref:Uncharacterized protein n=1 Tax=Mycobacteroides franklinii TaxID=948102 RepID=A0A4R5PAK0_9MYCO|nr:hypothetical protein EJ571_14255 [Mycobacteroides franklinii]
MSMIETRIAIPAAMMICLMRHPPSAAHRNCRLFAQAAHRNCRLFAQAAHRPRPRARPTAMP